MKYDKKSLGERIGQERNSLGLTQDKFAELVGISAPYIGGLENGKKNPSIETFVKLSLAIKKPMEALLLEDNERIEQYLPDKDTECSEQIRHVVDLMLRMSAEECDLIEEYVTNFTNYYLKKNKS